MFTFLKNHPFGVEAFFESSLVLTYAVSKEELISFIPECLTLDTFEDKWGFIAIAMVKTKNLRPQGFPAFMGNDFFLIGYRIFVRYTTAAGKRLRGLYIIKSETDKKKMKLLGNVFTHYKYDTTDIMFTQSGSTIKIQSKQSGLNVEIELNNSNSNLPKHSPFANWKEARRFAGPLPFTFTFDAITKKVLIIEGVRESWLPLPIEVIKNDVKFIEAFDFKNIALANAFIIQKIPYSWKKGKTEIWKK